MALKTRYQIRDSESPLGWIVICIVLALVSVVVILLLSASGWWFIMTAIFLLWPISKINDVNVLEIS
jgi:uncharacterized membrane protein